MARLRVVQCRRLVVPKLLLIEEFIAAGGGVHDSELWASSLAWADKRLKKESAAGILGASLVSSHGSCSPASAADSPSGLSGDSYHTTVQDDCDPDLKHTRMLLGARCSLISLATWYYVCLKSGLPESDVGGYVGSGQYPRFNDRPLVDRSLEASRYTCAHCDFWAIVSHLVKKLARRLTGSTSRGVLHQLFILLYSKASSLRVHWKDDFSDADLFNEWGVFLISPPHSPLPVFPCSLTLPTVRGDISAPGGRSALGRDLRSGYLVALQLAPLLPMLSSRGLGFAKFSCLPRIVVALCLSLLLLWVLRLTCGVDSGAVLFSLASLRG